MQNFEAKVAKAEFVIVISFCLCFKFDIQMWLSQVFYKDNKSNQDLKFFLA